MTLDLTLKSPPFYKEMQGNLEGESNSLSEVTQAYVPGTPTISVDND